MEGLGESEGKPAMFPHQKMSASCLGGRLAWWVLPRERPGGCWMGEHWAGVVLPRELGVSGHLCQF